MERRKRGRLVAVEVYLPLGVLAVAFCVGAGLGLAFVSSVDGAGGEVLGDYLRAYLQLAAGNSLPVHPVPILWEAVKLPLCVLVLTYSPLGVVGIPLVVGGRGFLLAYSVGCFVRVFGDGGLLAAGFLFGLTALITVPALFVLAVQGFLNSGALLRRSLGDRHASHDGGRGDCIRCGGCFVAILLSVAVECFAVPALLRSVAEALIL